MKKILSILMILGILFGLVPSALAAFSDIVESKPAYKSLSLDVAIEGIGEYEFYGSIGDGSIVPIPAKKIGADQIGHIIVVDLAWTWTTTINEQYVLVPAIQDYLSQLDSQSKVMFIFAGLGGPRMSSYMTVSEGYSYVQSNLRCITAPPGEIRETAIDASLKAAFTEAVQYSDGDPLFKTVFALVDPANPGKGMTATDIRNSYVKEGNAFPVLIATINPVTYIQEGRFASDEVEEGIKYYTQFAQSNGSLLNVMDFVYVPNQTFHSSYNVSETILNRCFYTLDLTPVHRFVDYGKATNELNIYISNSRGSAGITAAYQIPVSALPTALPTVTPTITPTPTPLPYIVMEGDSTPEARQAIKRLQELYYLKLSDMELPKEFNSKCAYALMDFCSQNGFKYEGNITVKLYEHLMSDEAIPAPTPTPTPAAVTPTPVVTPAPKYTAAPTPTFKQFPDTTVPPNGFRPGQTDTENSNFIARMQAILQNLNLCSEQMEPGTLDQPTLDAIDLYCRVYNLHLEKGEYIDRSIIVDILENGASRTPYQPSIVEQFSEFLNKEVMVLGDFHVTMWMLLIVIAVLLFVIILIIALSYKKTDDLNEHSVSLNVRNAHGASGRYINIAENVTQQQGLSNEHTIGAIQPMPNTSDNDEDATVKLGSGINVTLTISGGLSSGVQRVLISSKPFIIGRPTKNGKECDLPLEGDGSVSRKHVKLYYEDQKLYVENLSTNGTRINGEKLVDQPAMMVSDETVPLSAGANNNPKGFVLQNGDVIEISGYKIVVAW